VANTNAVNEKVSISAEQYRHRIAYEDQLAYARFNLVLVVNGFGALAVGFNQPIYTKLLLAIVMVVMNVLGTMAIRKTDEVIATLTRRFRHEHHDPLEQLVQDALGQPDWRRPNQILLRIFPVVLTVGWIAGVVLALLALR
jgi:hypothetical protein